MIKRNIKVISVFILGIVCALGVVCAYVITSKNVLVKVNGWNVKNTEEAIDYLKDKDRCEGLNPKPAKLKSGDLNTVGSIVQIKDEEFYVIGSGTGNEAGKVKLLAKNNLKNNNQVTSNADFVKFSETNYWSNRGLSYGTNPKPYVYDENSSLYDIVNAYANKIKRLGLNNVTGRLMSYEEANDLSYEIRMSAGSGGYWLGTPSTDSNLWYVNLNAVIFYDAQYNNDTALSVRPVILVPTSEIGE